MIDNDEPLDLRALDGDLQLRAERIASGVSRRVAAARSTTSLRYEVRRRLAWLALPASLAAAAGLVLAFTSGGNGAPLDRIARVIVPPSPLGRLLLQDRQPEIVELMVMMEPGR